MSTPRFAALAAIATLCAQCGGRSAGPTAPSNAPSVVQGSAQLSPFQFALINFRVDSGGTLTARIDWGNANNDIDTALLRGRCSVSQILSGASGCTETATIASDESFAKPSALSTTVQAGDHTLVVFNFGPGSDTAGYRLEGQISGGTAPAYSPVVPLSAGPTLPTGPRRTETFPFTLPAGGQAIVVGSVSAADGPLDVKLDFVGDHIVLACVGPSTGCRVMGGRPSSRTFVIPDELPAGRVEAKVYFNPTRQQPPGDVRGTVSLTYNPR